VREVNNGRTGRGRGARVAPATETAPRAGTTGTGRRGRYGAEFGRWGKARNGDAAPLPVPKRRCGVTTASEAKMRRQGRNGQRRRPPPRPPPPVMDPSGQPGKAAQRTARHPKTPTNPRRNEPSTRRNEPSTRPSEGAASPRVEPQWGHSREQRATGGLRGVSPRENTASHSEADRKVGEDRATPGGYGGKPPGVAFIGVPTGARNAGRCSDGGPEHRYACYTETPPCASRLGLRLSRSALFS
jgi:hypothetical protein